MKNLIIFLVFIFCFVFRSEGQDRIVVQKIYTDASDILQRAKDLFSAGDYDGCINLIEDFRVPGKYFFTKKAKEDILVLKTKAYIEKDNMEEAQLTVKKILIKNPGYELIENDHTEDYNRLVKKFVVYPLFTIGARNSALHPMMKTKKIYFVLEGKDYSAPYKSKTDFITEYYGWIEYGLNRSFSVNIEGSLNSCSYTREMNGGKKWQLNYSESMSFLEIPVYLKGYLPFTKNIISYASVGFGWMRMLSAKANIALYNQTDDEFDVLKMRRKNSFEAIGEVGLGYKFRNLKICLFGRYFKGLNSITNSARRFDNPELIENYYYIDNSVVLDKYELGASISFVIKNAVKKFK
jgi:hypothetical protein